MDPFTIAMIAGGASQLGGNLLGMYQQKKEAQQGRKQDGINIQRQLDHNEEMTDLNWKRNLQLLDKQNRYNAPTMQMKRLKEAGLNPHLLYGNGTASAGNMTGIGQYQAQTQDIMNQGSGYEGTGAAAMQMAGNLNDTIGQYTNSIVSKAQIQKINAETSKAEAEALGRQIDNQTQNERNLTSIAATRGTVGKLKSEVKTLKTNRKQIRQSIKESQEKIRKSQQDRKQSVAQIDKINVEKKKLINEIDLISANRKKIDSEIRGNKAKAKYQEFMNKRYKDTGLTEKDGAMTRAIFNILESAGLNPISTSPTILNSLATWLKTQKYKPSGNEKYVPHGQSYEDAKRNGAFD